MECAFPRRGHAPASGPAPRIAAASVQWPAEYNPFDSQDIMKLRRIAVASMVGAAGLAAGVWLRLPAARGNDPRALLVTAMGGVRPVEGRPMGLAAAPFQPAAAPRDHRALAAAARAVARRLATARGAEALADAALLKLAAHGWNQAAGLLAEAAAAAPRDAGVANDLAVVYLAQAAAERRPQRLVLALSAIEQAARLAPALPEPAFNRALILERLGLRDHARSAWHHYLTADTGSAWAAEARSHLTALDAAVADTWSNRRSELERALQTGPGRHASTILERHTQAARLWLETSVLVDWGRAVRRGDETAAAREQRTALAAVAGLRQFSDDRLASEAATAIERASGGRRQLLAQAYVDFGSAYALYQRRAFGEARALFARARDAFQQAESPFQAWGDFYVAACEYRGERITAAAAAGEELSRHATARSYWNVAGRAEWMLGLIALEEASPDQALPHLRQALFLFERTHEQGNQGAIASLIANCLDYLGDPGEAWRYRYRAIQAALAGDDAERLPAVYGAAARALLKQRELGAALAFQDEVLGLVVASKDPQTLAEAFWWRAMILHEAGQAAPAAADIARARSWAESIPYAPPRERALAGIAVTEGAVQRSSHPRQSVDALSRALARYRQLHYSYLLVDIYWERALSRLALGDFDAAEADLTAGIAEFERQRARVRDLERQASYFDRAQRVVEAMIAFELDRRRDPVRAFDFAERSKARTLLDLASRAAIAGAAAPPTALGTPHTAAEVRRQLPAGTFLLQYGVLADRLAIWCHWSGGGSFHEVPVDHDAPAARVERFTAGARDAASPADLAAPAERLFRLLVAPALAQLPEQATLVIVPDKFLAGVPFQALRDPATGRFLIERNPLTTAPSASLYVGALGRAERRRQPGPLSVLAVGNPAFDRARHAQLASLPYAAAEARQVAARNRQSLALLGEDATVARFHALANRYDLVHYSGHAIREGGSPLAASLALAPGRDGAPGDLSAAAIRGLRLTRPRLIVLAACGSGSGPRRELEGVSHLAGAFLAAGAPAVLANFWNVGDRGSQAFFALFYDELQAGRDPLGALQAAQMKMIRNPEPELRSPGAWAGFQLIGAVGSAGAIPERRHHAQALRRRDRSRGPGPTGVSH